MTRELRKSDIPRLQELYKHSPFAYSEPDWGKLSGRVLTDDSDVVLMCLAARPTVECYYFADEGAWTSPGLKFSHLERLHEALRRDLVRQGYTDAHLWAKSRSFARRLMRVLGWRRSAGPDGDAIGLVRNE